MSPTTGGEEKTARQTSQAETNRNITTISQVVNFVSPNYYTKTLRSNIVRNTR